MAKSLKWKRLLTQILIIAALNALFTVCYVHGKQVIQFTVEPVDEYVVNGRSVTFHCQVVVVDAIPDAVRVFIKWRGDDQSSFYDTRHDTRRSVLSNGSLHITNVGIEDEGNYQCVASVEPYGVATSRTARLNVITQVTLTEKQSQDLRVYPGQTAHFGCKIATLPRSMGSISWLKNERPLSLDRSRMTVMPSGSLEIDQVLLEDQGSYRCNASAAGLFKLGNKAVLTVNTDVGSHSVPPLFITRPKAAVVREGESICLDCAANGNPRPWIMWLKDGIAINMTNDRFVKIGTGSLLIRDIEEKDAGSYLCRAGNQEDSVDALAVVQVHVPPRFTRKPQDAISTEKKDIELTCQVYGKPDPKVVWTKDGELIKVNDYLQLSNGNNLRILGLMGMDSGIFQCMASNSAGNIQSSALLNVYSADEESPLLEEVNKFNLSRPLPKLPDKPTSKFKKEKKSSRQYFSAWSYTGGADISSLESPVSDSLTPTQPRDIRAETVSKRFVTLSWKKPEDTYGPLLFYSIFYRLEGSQRERVINTSGPSIEKVNVDGLQPDRLYHFRVAAHNSAGIGELSKDLEVSTSAEAHVPGPPIEINVIATSPTSLFIEWKPPSTAYEEVLKYRLFYMEEDSAEESHIYTSKTSYELNRLKKFREYLLWVIAENKNGPGSASDEIAVKTLSDVPSEAPTNITVEATGSTSIIVRWEPPPKDGQHGVITGYKLRYKKAKGRGLMVTAAGDRRLYALSDLDKNSTYQIRLFAMNVNGTGPPSEWITVDTYSSDLDETQVPDEPTNLVARSSSNSIRVSWGSPKDSNIMVRGYTVGWGKGIPDDYTKVLEGKQRNFNIEDLEVNSEYVIAVRAFNNIGDGPPAYLSIYTRDEQMPQSPLIPPVGLKATVISSTTVMLYWTEASHPKSQVSSDDKYYTVRYTWAYNTANPRPKYINVTGLNCMINELRPNTVYEFSVKLTTGRRESDWSMVVHNTTQEAPPSSAPRDLTVVPVYNSPGHINLNWQPPKQGNGLITGYVVFYTTDDSLPDNDWVVQSITGDKMTAVLKGLKTGTTYHLKIQAANSKGFGPLSNKVTFVTPASSGNDVNMFITEGKSVTSMMLIIIGCSFMAILGVTLIISIVCCKRAKSRRRNNTYLKGNMKLKTSIKPPDLWIHHDQMELKNLEKSHNSSSDIGQSSSGSQINTLVRATSSHPSEFNHTASLDKRSYVPNYVGTPCTNQEKTSTIKRSLKPKSISLPMDSQPLNQPTPTATQSPGCPTYSRTPFRSHLGMEPAAFESPYSIQAGYDSIPTIQHAATLPNTYQTGMASTVCPATTTNAEGTSTLTKRQLNHPLKSFSVPAPPPQSAPNTPQQKHIVRSQPNTSPYKKSTHGAVCTGSPSNTKLRTGPGTTEEATKLQTSYSTEELNQEMANLEGLMKDLNAITASEFEC